jgi:hypothetical protein
VVVAPDNKARTAITRSEIDIRLVPFLARTLAIPTDGFCLNFARSERPRRCGLRFFAMRALRWDALTEDAAWREECDFSVKLIGWLHHLGEAVGVPSFMAFVAISWANVSPR